MKEEKTVDIGLTLEESWLVRALLSDFVMMLENKTDSESKKDLHKRAAKLLCRFENVYGGRIGLEKYKENENEKCGESAIIKKHKEEE